MRRATVTRTRLLLAGAGVSLTLAACLVGFDSGPRASAQPEAGLPAASAPTPAPDATVEEDSGAHFAFEDEGHWEEHLLAGSFAGAAFDGRFVYFVPRGHLTLWRYDTAAGFDEPSAWESVTLPGADAAASGFAGAAFSGGHVYLAPALPVAAALRYDVSKPFTSASWEVGFHLDDLAGVEKSVDFMGVVPYDGAVYFIPHRCSTIVRYDPDRGFADKDAWSGASTPNPDAGGFAGGVAMEQALYLVPAGRPLVVLDGLGVLDAGPGNLGQAVFGNYLGGTTDGTRLYLAPATGTVAAAVSLAPIPVSVAVLELRAFVQCSGACFAGAVFDGRFVYYVPRNRARFVRYDTQAPQGFSDVLSWSVGPPDAGATSFFGGAFDGRYVYFVPDGVGKVVRFHAREPAAMPASHSGSFL